MGTQNHPHKTQHKTGGFHNGSNRTQNSRHLRPGSRWSSQQIGANTVLFIPDFSVSRYDPSTGEVYGYAPDYDALEAAKAPAVQATAPASIPTATKCSRPPRAATTPPILPMMDTTFCAPCVTVCPRSTGCGITYDAEQGTYMVTPRL